MSIPASEVFPLLWVDNVDEIADWAMRSLGLTQSWRTPGANDDSEHAELLWPGGRVSINIKADAYAHTGPGGIALRVSDRDAVDAVYRKAKEAGANAEPPAESTIAYSFTAIDPAGNQWWVHAENGLLDQLRQPS